jgi:serine kinase of HPr protein (carbohydrate metabolism regulator)
MTVKQLVDNLKLKVFSGASGLNNEITGGYVSDLLSDVIGNANEGQIWATLQTHKNVIAVASLKDLSAVIIVKGLMPDDACMEKSNEEGIPILGTSDYSFELSGKIYKLME